MGLGIGVRIAVGIDDSHCWITELRNIDRHGVSCKMQGKRATLP